MMKERKKGRKEGEKEELINMYTKANQIPHAWSCFQKKKKKGMPDT